MKGAASAAAHRTLRMTATALAPGRTSEGEMAQWKQLVRDALADGAAVELQYFGGANQITGYRLFYMLQYAKRAGVVQVALLSDGVFWIDEATEWLLASRLDEIRLRLAGGVPAPPLRLRIDRLAALSPDRPAITVIAS